MLKKSILFVFLAFLFQSIFAQTKITGNDFTLTLDKGKITGIIDIRNNQNYVNEPAYLLSIAVKNERLYPQSMQVSDNIITLVFPKNIKVKIRYLNKPSHITFEVEDVQPKNVVTGVIWNINTTISETIGECVGVVRNQDFAIGIQALNAKTTGGIYQNDDGFTGERGNTAVKTETGSRLEAFSLDRSVERKLNVWNEYGVHFPNMPVPPIKGETTVGSKIAVFGCPPAKALNCIGEIEAAEGLPHIMLNGKWIKKSLEVRIPYMITGFNEENFDELLSWAEAGGFSGIYQDHPFETWGHFKLSSKAFPNGRAGFKQCADKAHAKGLRIGAHTLTTFLTPNDAFITPVPDRRLAVTGSSVLKANIDEKITDIRVEDTTYFAPMQYNALKTVRIGDELIQYSSVSASQPFKLLNCTRGAFGTKATPHTQGETVSKLLDYPYEVFFPNFDMQHDVASNLAAFLNETGVDHIDFDGHEGCYATGQGEYGMEQYVLDVMSQTKHFVFNGSSRAKHFYWHSASYLNWGEPWYGGFRESQNDYRINNQAYYERNYLPNMLGWFLLTPTTSVDDINWMMARAAGYNAGFAFVTRLDAIKMNPNSPELFALVKLWSSAIQNQIFTDEQRTALKNVNNEFHLEKVNNQYHLYPFTKYDFEHAFKRLQPGEPTFSLFNFNNKEKEQAFKMTIYISGEKGNTVENISLDLDNKNIITLPEAYPSGTTLLFSNQKLKVYNNKGALVAEKDMPNLPKTLTTEQHTLKSNAKFSEEDMRLKISVKVMGKELK